MVAVVLGVGLGMVQGSWMHMMVVVLGLGMVQVIGMGSQEKPRPFDGEVWSILHTGVHLAGKDPILKMKGHHIAGEDLIDQCPPLTLQITCRESQVQFLYWNCICTVSQVYFAVSTRKSTAYSAAMNINLRWSS